MAERSRADVFACPRCGGVICQRDERGKPTNIPVLDYAYFETRKLKCRNRVTKTVWESRGRMVHKDLQVECGEPLYQMWRGKFSTKPVTDTPTYPLSEYIRRRLPKVVELAIVIVSNPSREKKG